MLYMGSKNTVILFNRGEMDIYISDNCMLPLKKGYYFQIM